MKLYFTLREMADYFNCAPSKVRFLCKEIGIKPRPSKHQELKFHRKEFEALKKVFESAPFTTTHGKKAVYNNWIEIKNKIYESGD